MSLSLASSNKNSSNVIPFKSAVHKKAEQLELGQMNSFCTYNIHPHSLKILWIFGYFLPYLTFKFLEYFDISFRNTIFQFQS